MDQRLDFTIIKRAGLTQQEFAQLCEVTRTTVNLWVKGGSQPHKCVRRRVATLAAAMTRAVDAALLPLPLDDGARVAHIRLALREAAKKSQAVEA